MDHRSPCANGCTSNCRCTGLPLFNHSDLSAAADSNGKRSVAIDSPRNMSLFGYNCGPSFPVSPSNRIVWGVPDSDSEPKVTPIKKPSTKKRPFVFSPETETVSRPARPTGVIFGSGSGPVSNTDSGDEEAWAKANGNFLFGPVPRKPGFDPAKAKFSFGVASVAEANAREEDANADSGDEEARVKANGNFLFGSVPRKPGFDPAQFSFGVASIAEANAKAEAKKWCGGGNCKKRVGLLGFKCRCKKIFCGKHRYPEEHGCTFDHVAFGRQIIQKQNPLIETDKLENRI